MLRPREPLREEQPPEACDVIVADDLGSNDLTFAGGGVAQGAVPTPHSDSIAREGVEYARAHAGNATCLPSRTAIMTGRYPTRFGVEFTPAPKQLMRLVAWLQRHDPDPPTYFADREADVPPMDRQGRPPGEITIAELLRAHGYRTLGLGKWHPCEAPAMRPTARGAVRPTSTSRSAGGR